jgi:putative hydroxymethylpyrimidine transport system substrate-binding protein
MMKRWFATALAATLLMAPPAGSGAAAIAGSVRTPTVSHHVTLMLDWYPNSDHAGIYIAIQRGFLARHRIDLTARVPSDTSAQIPLVASGHADFGISYETDLLAARARHIPVKSVMCITQNPLNTVMALTSSGITRPRQLAGHSVGMAGSPSDIPIVSAMMRHDGSSVSNVRMVNVGYNLLTSLLARKVDAVVGVYWTWEAIQARQRGDAVNVMRVEKWGVPNYCELVLVVSEATIRSQPALVRDTVRALQQGYAYAETHPDAAWSALHARFKTLNRALVIQSLSLLKGTILAARTVGYQDGAQWAAYAHWLIDNHLVSGSVNAAAAFTNQFLQSDIR